MACTVKRPTQFEVSLDTKDQTREKIFAVVDALLRENATIECGLLGAFSISLGEGFEKKHGSEPAPELRKLGVTSLKKS